ncbi:reverse transcriptase N-terminal domain-containing protein [Trebonia kvetii]|uniref:reverse transcriptase N-terminal domain-containing protein n=1 Tax=Trebonia kvetii TaxID=2480626 RepID=UPI001651B8F5|nr:reverse transcriptase N-terminal domain-containing protein [Trebonia kvetii]
MPEPMGTLDAAAANGPEGGAADWDAVDWSRTEADVRRLRQRIFTASKAGDLKKVRSLQRLMLRSRANALVSVRRVTEVNAGRYGVKTAQDLIGEIGTDMSVFPTAGHLCSWARVAPRVKESGGKRKGGSAAGEGNPYIGAALGEAAVSAGRTQTFLGAKLRRLVRRMPAKKARGAVMRTQLCIAHALLSDPGAGYRELGPGYYDQRAGTRRQALGHIRSLERLGYKVTLEPVDPETEELTAQAG